MKPLRLSKPPWAFGLVACSVAVGTLLCSVGVAVASDPPAEQAAEQAAAVAPSPAAETVGRLHEKLLEAMMRADELGYLGRFELLTPALKDTFDLDFMASKSVGRSWKTLSEEQKRQWQDAFGRLITANFAGRFEGYSGQSFETLGEQAAAHGTIMVLTRIVDPEDDDVQLNYRMQEKDERWRIVDVYFNGTVSELALRRSEYSSMFKREGFEKLLEAVDQRIADFASGEID